MKIYNKLVRDKIPKIIKSRGVKACNTRILNDKDYLSALNAKLQEEVNEYLSSGEIEELADIEEVLRAILDAKKISYENFESIRITKSKNKGAFREKIFLESVDE